MAVEITAIPHGARRTTPTVEWSRNLASPSLAVASALDGVRRAPTILDAMRVARDAPSITEAVLRVEGTPAGVLAPIVDTIEADEDTVAAIAAIHALGRIPGQQAEPELARLVTAGRPGYDEHAIWALEKRPPSPSLMQPLAYAVARGRLGGMHAQRILARWGQVAPDSVLDALEDALGESTSTTARRRLVETVGLVAGRRARKSLVETATDASEGDLVRTSAIAAFAERTGERLPSSVGRLGRHSGSLGEAVRTVRAQRGLIRRGPLRADHRELGIRVAQVHLGAALDDTVSRAGMGDTGGVATLLSRLGGVLAGQNHVAEVISIGRSVPDGRSLDSRTASGHRFERVSLEPGEGSTFAGDWPAVVAAERGVRAALLARTLPDVIHLRMADPGTLVAARLARELGVSVVFTLAPDPHGPIDSAERAGELDRTSFAAQDASSALWFRANLVEQLARDADEIALFPRPRLRHDLRELLGFDIFSGRPRHTLVPEGVDTRLASEAERTVLNGASEPPVITTLCRAVSELPRSRHGLPVVVSVGRLHQVKGMARTVEAFALDERLAAGANLVIVGGDLEDPSAAEAAELARIRALFDRYRGLEERVILLGHRPNDEVGLILATARLGAGGLIGPSGAYVCGSLKEEFGLAIVEAMAAGLPVVVPRSGGPASYVDEAVTGFIVDTTDPAAIATGVRLALRLAQDPETAKRTRTVVEQRFTLDRMARTLAAVYRVAGGARTLARPVRTEAAA